MVAELELSAWIKWKNDSKGWLYALLKLKEIIIFQNAMF